MNDVDEATAQLQLDVAVRLRIIEQLQALSFARTALLRPDDVLIDVLNWLGACLVHYPKADSVALAFSANKGIVNLYIANDFASLKAPPHVDALRQSVSVFTAILKQVLKNDLTPDLATRAFLRMVINTCYPRLQRKIFLIGRTDISPAQTYHRFNNLVCLWLLYRPTGEQSPGFVNMAAKFGDASRASEFLAKAFLSLVNHDGIKLERMSSDDAHAYLLSTITACGLLVNSTFFDDLSQNHSFRLSLKIADRLFLHKIFRRISRIAAYKNGAIKFAYLAIPFLRSVLGPTGISDFVDDEGAGGIKIHYVGDYLREKKTTVSRPMSWPTSPLETLPIILGLGPDEDSMSDDTGAHSRETSSNSMSTSSSSSTGYHSFRTELSQIDAQLRSDLLNSELLASAWVTGDRIELKMHCELQLIHFLLENNVQVARMAIGTSKPVCWTCGRYIENMELGEPIPPELEEDGGVERWWHSKASGKVYHDWMIPPLAHVDTIEAVIQDAQSEMERVVEEVAFDCYL